MPGPHRTRQRCSGPACDRRTQGLNSSDGCGEDRASAAALLSLGPRGHVVPIIFTALMDAGRYSPHLVPR